MSGIGVSVANTVTRSTQASAASTPARSSAGLIGRSGPFSRRTESSSFRATTSRSPRSRAWRRYVVCPRCTTSKQPFVKTTRRPACRAASTAVASSSWSTTVAAGAVTESSRAAAVQTDVPASRTTTSAAAWATATASRRGACTARATVAAAQKVSPAPEACCSEAGVARVRNPWSEPGSSSTVPSRSSVTTAARAPLRASTSPRAATTVPTRSAPVPSSVPSSAAVSPAFGVTRSGCSAAQRVRSCASTTTAPGRSRSSIGTTSSARTPRP